MVDRHRSISGVASDVCGVVRLRAPDDRELEEGSRFEDIDRLPQGIPASSSGKEYDGLERVTFFHSPLGVTSRIAVMSKKSDELRGRPLCVLWNLLGPSGKRGSSIVKCLFHRRF